MASVGQFWELVIRAMSAKLGCLVAYNGIRFNLTFSVSLRLEQDASGTLVDFGSWKPRYFLQITTFDASTPPGFKRT